MINEFEKLLTGGHPNSLGNTLQVVEAVLKDKPKLADLYACYQSPDEVVRLRVSNAMKRVTIEHQDWTYEYADKLLNEITKLDQASAQWTLAILFRLMHKLLTPQQKLAATKHIKHNLEHHPDWIVINTSMETLFEWSKSDEELKEWLIPVLQKFTSDSHRSISSRATKYLQQLAVSS